MFYYYSECEKCSEYRLLGYSEIIVLNVAFSDEHIYHLPVLVSVHEGLLPVYSHLCVLYTNQMANNLCGLSMREKKQN